MSPRRTLAAIALLASTLALPASVLANTNEPIAQTGGMEATLPLLGTSLTVGVSLDDVGKITGVTMNPADPSKVTLTQTKATDSAVKFANADGTTKVSVKAKGAKLSITARSTKLADLLGDGTWAADVFGTGAKSTVDYTIGQTDGKPTVTIQDADISAAADITATTGDSKQWSHKRGSRSWASNSVVFSHDGFVKVLRVTVGVGKDGKAALSITLKGRDRQRVEGTLEALAGQRTWSAHLCNGGPVTVTYAITTAGAVEFVGATGGETTEKTFKHGLAVRFDGTRVGVAIRLHQTKNSDTWRLTVKGSSGHCGTPKVAKHNGAGQAARYDKSHHTIRAGWFGHGDGDRKGDSARNGGHNGSGGSQG